MDAYLKLQQWWVQTGAGVKIATAPVSNATIDELAQRYNLTLPGDFRCYLSHSSPVAENWDDEMGNWWPIDRIKNIPDEYEHTVPPFIPGGGRTFLFFLDHSIWCWAWAISCGDDASRGKIALIGGNQERFVADSFSEFVDRYTSDWLSVA